MHRRGRSPFTGLVTLLGLCLLTAPARAASFEMSYCSSQNTADSSPLWNEFQSNGWCTDECNKQGKFAYAVLLFQDCWCSNYAPEDQQDTGDCRIKSCPGFGTEYCGNQDKNLYAYIKLAGSPSGTKGTSKPTSVNSDTSSKAAPTTLRITRTSKEAPTTVETQRSEEPQEPQTSVRVITQSGQIVTETVVTSPSSAPVKSSSRKSTTNTGAIVGGVVGGVAGVAAVVGGIFFILWRRRQQRRQEDEPQSGVQRNTSTMSKVGLLRRGTEKEPPQYPAPIATSFTRRSSRMLDQESISPISGSDRRNSRHLVDQRLNPSAIFVFDNSSRGSVASIDDSRDYHRALNIRNPDLE